MEEHSLFLDWVSSLASNTDDADKFLGPRPEDVVQFPTDAPDVDNVAGALRDLHRGSDDMGVRISRIYIDVGAGRVAALDVYPSAVDGQVKLVAIPRREAMMAWPRPKPVRLQAPYASLRDLLEIGKVWIHPPGRGPAMVERARMPDKTRPIPLENLWGPYDAERPFARLRVGGRRQRRGSSRRPGKARPSGGSTSRRHGGGRQQRRTTGRSRSRRSRARR